MTAADPETTMLKFAILQKTSMRQRGALGDEIETDARQATAPIHGMLLVVPTDERDQRNNNASEVLKIYLPSPHIQTHRKALLT